MKRIISILVAALFALPLVQAQTNVAYSGVSLFTGTPATATFTTGPVKLPTFSGEGLLTLTGTGITGSPSGCTVALTYQGNNAPVTSSTAAFSVSVTPASSVQTFAVTPTPTLGDNYVAKFTCTTYPTAGTLTASLSPITPPSLDICSISPKSSVPVAITTATTTQLVALAANKIVHVCGFDASFGATTTAQLEYGTGSACGTGTTVLTGTYAPATGTLWEAGNGNSTFTKTIASNALCLVSTGTGGIQGVLTYVQQ